ncbi:MAG: Calx-beta domain-containing protein [Pyrinomonadaceae bacterium]
MSLPRRYSPQRRTTARARPTKTFVFTLATALACGLLLYATARPAGAANVAAPTPQTGLVNVTASGAASAQGARWGSITPDGRYVVFTTSSPDLAPNDNNGGPFSGGDVFVRDRRAGRTILVSINRSGTGTGNATSGSPVITPDGRYVAFISSASDLVPPGGPNTLNVYRRDLLTNQTVLVSQTPAGLRGNSSSGSVPEFAPNLSISADGRYISFVSNASDLVPGDTNARSDAFVRDVQQGVTNLVSVNQSGTGPGNSETYYAVMTPNGRFVAFLSSAADLTPKVTPPGSQVYLRDLQAGTTKLVSGNRIDGSANNTSSDSLRQGDLDVSDDGRFVAFVSEAPDLVAGDSNGRGDQGQDVFVRDTVAETTHLVSVNRDGSASGHGPSGGLSMTPDGRFVAFISSADDIVPNDTNGVQDVFVRDVQAGTTALITANTSGAPAGIPNRTCQFIGTGPFINFNAPDRPSVSADGRYVAFRSAAAALSATPDTNCPATFSTSLGGYDIYVRDMQAGSNRLVSTNRTGDNAGARSSSLASITPDGRHVLFASYANDLVGNDLVGDETQGPLSDLFVNVSLPAAGQVQFAQHVFSVSESAGQAVVTVTRTTGTGGAATVAYTTLSGGTAASGSEFTPTSGTLDFAAGEESKQFVVPLLNDAVDEADETVYVRLTDEAGGSVGEPAYAAILIADDDPSPRLSVSDARLGEGDYDLGEMTFLVTLSEPSVRTITANFTTQNGTATGGTWPGGNYPPGVDYENFQGTYTFPPGATRGLLKVRVFPDTTLEPDETFSVVFSNPVNVEIANGVGVGTIVDDDGAVFTKVQLSTNAHTVSETAGRLEVQLTRTGDLSKPSSVGYWSLPFTANTSPRTDYTEPSGVVYFAAGESSKTLTVFVTDDALLENDEQFYLVLFEPEGCTIGAPGATLITIQSDDAADGPSPARQQGSTAFFVRQHYRDFLGRDPDDPGLAFWTNEIEKCGADQQCREVKRVNVSAAFFLSIEFQQTGYLAYKSFKAAYGNLQNRPVPIQLFWFLHDAQMIGRGVVVNQGDWQGQLEQNKREYFDHFARSEIFNLAYPASLPPAEFVAALDANAGGVLTANERAALVAALTAGTKTRAEVLRAVAENAELSRRELNRAFVLMEYFGYLRRNPDDSPDFNFNGYNFWLGKLEEHNGNYIEAEMVKAFISSDEYLKRFGQ